MTLAGVDRVTSTDADNAALHDRQCPWTGVDATFYDGLVDAAVDVLDGEVLRGATAPRRGFWRSRS